MPQPLAGNLNLLFQQRMQGQSAMQKLGDQAISLRQTKLQNEMSQKQIDAQNERARQKNETDIKIQEMRIDEAKLRAQASTAASSAEQKAKLDKEMKVVHRRELFTMITQGVPKEQFEQKWNDTKDITGLGPFDIRKVGTFVNEYGFQHERAGELIGAKEQKLVERLNTYFHNNPLGEDGAITEGGVDFVKQLMGSYTEGSSGSLHDISQIALQNSLSELKNGDRDIPPAPPGTGTQAWEARYQMALNALESMKEGNASALVKFYYPNANKQELRKYSDDIRQRAVEISRAKPYLNNNEIIETVIDAVEKERYDDYVSKAPKVFDKVTLTSRQPVAPHIGLENIEKNVLSKQRMAEAQYLAKNPYIDPYAK